MTNPGSITTSQVTEWMIEEGLTDKKFNFFKTEEEFMEKAGKYPPPVQIVYLIQAKQKKQELG